MYRQAPVNFTAFSYLGTAGSALRFSPASACRGLRPPDPALRAIDDGALARFGSVPPPRARER